MKPNLVLIVLAIICIVLASVLIALTATIEPRYYVYPADQNTAVPMPEWTRHEKAGTSA